MKSSILYRARAIGLVVLPFLCALAAVICVARFATPTILLMRCLAMSKSLTESHSCAHLKMVVVGKCLWCLRAASHRSILTSNL